MQKKILIIDDDRSILDVLNIIFSEDYLVKIVNNSTDFSKLLTNFKPDLVIIDYLLHEDLTGEDICFALRENPETSHIPAIVLSVVDNLILSDKLKNCHFIPKPFDLSCLTAKVKELITVI